MANKYGIEIKNKIEGSQEEEGHISSAAFARERLQKRQERERKRKKRILISAVSAAAVALLVGIAALVCVLKVRNYQGIYPSVFAAGVDLAGMSEEEAADAVKRASDEYFASQKVTLKYDTDTLDIYGSDIQMSMDAPAAARAAMAYGKNFRFFDRLRLVSGRADPVEPMTTISYNPAMIEEKVNEFTRLVRDKIETCNYELTEDMVVVDLSGSGMVLNKATIITDVSEMFEEKRFETYEAVPEIVTPQTLDVEAIYEGVCCEPVNAELLYVPEDWTEETADQFDPGNYSGKLKYYVKPDSPGLSFDLEAARTELAASKDGKIFKFPLIKKEAEISEESISSKIYRDVIGRATSTLNPREVNRTTNVRLATEFVNGIELMPGEVFSYNRAVGQRTEKRGFKDAGTFVKGEVVDEIGGGICQLSSTIYMATLRSNLEQVSRSAHRFAVTYTPLGQDATVYWGSLDYQFKNDTDYPIKIYAHLDGDTLLVKIYGTKVDGYSYKLESKTDEEIPFEEETVYVTLSSKEAKEYELTKIGQKKTVSGKKGYKSTTYVIKLDENGNEIDRWVANHSSYKTRTKTTYIACVKNASGKPYLDKNGEPYDPNREPETTPATEPKPKPDPEEKDTGTPDPDTGELNP